MQSINYTTLTSFDCTTMPSVNDTIMPSDIDTSSMTHSLSDIDICASLNVTPALLPCKKGHEHHWNKSGVVVIEKCEEYCQFCAEKGKETHFKYAWHLRRHVQQVHAAHEFDGQLTVAEGWSGAPNGNDKTGFRNRKNGNTTKKVRKAKKVVMRAASPSPPVCLPSTETTTTAPSQTFLPGFDTISLPADPMMPQIQTVTSPDFDFSTNFGFGSAPVLEGIGGGDALTIDPMMLQQPSAFVENSAWSSESAEFLACGLDQVVGDAVAAGDFSDAEALVVLENYVQRFKLGRGL